MNRQAIHASSFLEAGLAHMQDSAYFGLMGEAASKERK